MAVPLNKTFLLVTRLTNEPQWTNQAWDFFLGRLKHDTNHVDTKINPKNENTLIETETETETKNENKNISTQTTQNKMDDGFASASNINPSWFSLLYQGKQNQSMRVEMHQAKSMGELCRKLVMHKHFGLEEILLKWSTLSNQQIYKGGFHMCPLINKILGKVDPIEVWDDPKFERKWLTDAIAEQLWCVVNDPRVLSTNDKQRWSSAIGYNSYPGGQLEFSYIIPLDDVQPTK